MNSVINRIFEEIEKSASIMLFRHRRIDGDCAGATKGMKALIKCTWPEKDVYIIDNEKSEFLAFMGPDDEEVPDGVYKNSLGIVIDVGNADRISNQKFRLCSPIIKIDHHIDREAYGDINWVEEERSSACEMIAYFYSVFQDKLKINSEAATHIYTGMLTDSGRFQYDGVTGDTLRLAGLMLDQGIDMETLNAHLYMRDFDQLKFKAFIYENMCQTPGGVAYIHITKEMQAHFHLSFESASSAISSLSDIKGILCWLAFIDSDNGEIRVRLRSRFAHINTIAEKYHGGGHACASGATVYSPEEMANLISDADRHIKEYKSAHEGWI